MSTTDLEATQGTELSPAEEQALAAELIGGIDQQDLILPVVKLTQPLTREVTDKKVEAGRFFNSLSGADYGDELDLIVAYYFKGRFYAPDDDSPDADGDRVFVASGDVVPANWPERWAGKHFADLAESLEGHQARANDPDDQTEWGSGPLIETTHNFIGFIPEDPGSPVRLSLKSTSTPAARKVLSICRYAGTFWGHQFHLTVAGRENKKKQPYFIVEAVQGEQTTAEQRQTAAQLGRTAKDADIQLTGSEVEDTPRDKAGKSEKPAGGVDVA